MIGIKNKLRILRNRPVRLLIDGPKSSHHIKTLGTTYGGWMFVDLPELRRSTIISAGAGEDVSFDIKFAQAYEATIIIADPTPRAIEHVNAVRARCGKAADREFVGGGKQPVEAYDLTGVSADQIRFVEKGLWNDETTLRFFAPPNPDHVSHSAINFLNDYSRDTEFISVPVTTIDRLGAPTTPPLVKLDIEGAEIEVLEDMLDKGIFPTQICVEYDELHNPKPHANRRVLSIDGRLRDNGYRLVCTDQTQANFLYVKD